MEFTITAVHSVTALVFSGYLKNETITLSRIIIGTAAEEYLRNVGSQPVMNRSQSLMVQHFFAYLDGVSGGLPEVEIDYGKVTDFQAAVLNAARTVPFGTTWCYSKLAEKAGFPKALRAVASVMRHNRIPLLVPCHRIVRKNGSTGAFCGDQRGADALLKKTLLQLEQDRLKKCCR